MNEILLVLSLPFQLGWLLVVAIGLQAHARLAAAATHPHPELNKLPDLLLLAVMKRVAAWWGGLVIAYWLIVLLAPGSEAALRGIAALLGVAVTLGAGLLRHEQLARRRTVVGEETLRRNRMRAGTP